MGADWQWKFTGEGPKQGVGGVCSCWATDHLNPKRVVACAPFHSNPLVCTIKKVQEIIELSFIFKQQEVWGGAACLDQLKSNYVVKLFFKTLLNTFLLKKQLLDLEDRVFDEILSYYTQIVGNFESFNLMPFLKTLETFAAL